MGLEWVENEGRWEDKVGCWWKEGWVRECMIAATCGHVDDSQANKGLSYGVTWELEDLAVHSQLWCVGKGCAVEVGCGLGR